MSAARRRGGGITSAAEAGAVRLSVALLLAAVLSSPALAASATGHVSVTILPAGAVIEDTPIRFAGAGPAISSGHFTLAGAPHAAVSLSFGPGQPSARPNPAISVSQFAHNAGPSPSLNGAGILNIAVGATLTLASPPSEGSYSGTYTVVVNY